MAAETENLDARMEAIRLKNDELERKHQISLEDEESAKRENAVVDVKNRVSETRTPHPYDNIDLDFDVKDVDKELSVNPDYKPKNRRPLPRKDLLDEIPPDPVNFLREDGEDRGTEAGPNPRPSPNNKTRNNNNNRNRQDRPRTERNRNEADNNTGESPPRPRNQNPRPRPQQPQQQRSPQDVNAPKRPIHPQQLRNERRSVPAQNSNDEQQRQSGQSPQNPNRQRRPNNRTPNKEGGGDRNNITVEITDGELRSVKLKSSEKSFGTGRVGHVRSDNTQKFSVDTFDPNSTGENTQHDRSPQDKSRNRPPRNRRNQKPKEFQHPTLENIVITKSSVQDRLARIVKDNEVKSVQEESQPSTGN